MKKLMFFYVLVMVFTLIIIAGPVSAGRSVLEVGPGREYETIQAAVDAAKQGSVIHVYPDTYVESVSIIKNRLQIIAQDDDVVVRPPETDERPTPGAFQVIADYVTIRGFEIAYGESCAPGIYFEGSHNTFTENYLYLNATCLGANALVSRDHDGGTNYNIIEGNTIDAADLGIVIVAATADAINTGNVIQDNTLLAVAQTPIAVGNGKGFKISGNSIAGAPFGHCIAVGTLYGNEVAQGHHDITNNRMSYCAGNGISLYAEPGAVLSHNRISENTVQNCGYDCIALEAGSGASLTHNQVVGNEASFSGICGITLGAEPWDAPDAAVSNNMVRDNLVYRNLSGICLNPKADNNQVLKNVAQDQTADGIVVFGEGNKLVGNSTHDNDFVGIEVRGDDNSIINNSALRNGQFDLVDLGVGNKWRSNTYDIANWQPVVGWAVGDSADGYGTILYTTDGGDTWLRQGQPDDTPNVNFAAVSAIDANNAWAVGEDVILRTRDGGLTWEQQALPKSLPPGSQLMGVKAIDGKTAWAVGFPDLLLQTKNGRTWKVMPQGVDLDFPFPVDYEDVDAADATHVWAVGSHGTGTSGRRGETVIAFYDGVQWRRQGAGVIPNDGDNSLIGVSVFDQDTVWAVGGWDLPLMKTTDGGATWQQVGLSLSPNDANQVVAVTADIGWVAGDFGSIQRTDDGGLNWDNTNTGIGSYAYGITAMDAQRAWSVAPSGFHQEEPGWLLRTLDGQNWEATRAPAGGGLWGISFVGARR